MASQAIKRRDRSEVISELVKRYGIGSRLTDELRKMNSIQRKRPEDVDWTGSMSTLSRAANHNLLQTVESLLKKNPEKLSNVQIKTMLRADLESVPSSRRAQEMVSATTRALADAGIIREHSSRAGKIGGGTRVFSHPTHGNLEVNPNENPALYLFNALHEAGGMGSEVAAKEMYKTVELRGKKVGNPEGIFDSRSIHKAATRAAEEGLVKINVEESRLGERSITAKRFKVRFTEKGKKAWKDHLRSGCNDQILKASKRRKRK